VSLALFGEHSARLYKSSIAPSPALLAQVKSFIEDE
jgi:hypothetical protein